MWLDIAMHNSLSMRILKAVCDLRNILTSIVDGDRMVAFHQRGEAFSVDIFHHEKMIVIGLFSVIGRHDIGVGKSRSGLDFTVEAFHHLRVADQRLIDHFECHRPFHVSMFGFKDDAHPSSGNPADDFIARMICKQIFD